MTDDQLKAQVSAALEGIRPNLQADGGDVELVEVTPDGVVKLKLTGACSGCPMAQLTLKRGIEPRLKKKVAAVTRVELM